MNKLFFIATAVTLCFTTSLFSQSKQSQGTIRLKEIFGPDIFVLGYSNDPNMAYIPSLRILNEGGYEGETSQQAKGLPSKWAPDIEQLIMTEMVRLAGKAGVKQLAAK